MLGAGRGEDVGPQVGGGLSSGQRRALSAGVFSSLLVPGFFAPAFC